MTAYVDRLEGDVLHWQGQTAGSKDDLVIEHLVRGLEILVFYRESKATYPGHAFRYEGEFTYSEHHGANPASFELVRTPRPGLERLPPATMSDPFDRGTEAAVAGGTGPCLVSVIAALRQSGADSVVADGRLTELQRRMHVPDRIEDWVAERVSAWRDSTQRVPLLIVLSGNAGDGKSDLIERLRARPGVWGPDVDVVADATHAESPSQSQSERLIGCAGLFQSEVADPAPDPRCVLVAINVGMVIAFFSGLRDLGRAHASNVFRPCSKEVSGLRGQQHPPRTIGIAKS